jgi:hypothetical protein
MRIKILQPPMAVHNLYLWGVAASYALPGNASMQFDRTQASRLAAKDSRRGIPKNKSVIRGTFFEDKKRSSTNHDSPRIHHKFTIKKPRSTTHFRQKPLQNNENPPSKKTRPKFRSTGMALPNTNGSLISGQVRLIVEVGGLSNDEVYTNSHRGFALRVIFCHIRKFDRKCHIAQHEPRRENRAVPGGSVIPPACCSGRSQISVPGQLPGFAHLLPLFD